MKRRAVRQHGMVADHLYSSAGGDYRLSLFGELHLGKRRAERARAMWPSTAKWLNDLKACKHIFAEDNSPVAESCSSSANGVRALAA
jgi:hypothetical protein